MARNSPEEINFRAVKSRLPSLGHLRAHCDLPDADPSDLVTFVNGSLPVRSVKLPQTWQTVPVKLRTEVAGRSLAQPPFCQKPDCYNIIPAQPGKEPQWTAALGFGALALLTIKEYR